jgi:hypothetical protein
MMACSRTQQERAGRHAKERASVLAITLGSPPSPLPASEQPADGSSQGAGGGGSDNIKVVVRVRPLFPPEVAKGAVNVVAVAEDCGSMKVRHAVHAAMRLGILCKQSLRMPARKATLVKPLHRTTTIGGFTHTQLSASALPEVHARPRARPHRPPRAGHRAWPRRRQHAARVRLPCLPRP